MPRLNILLLTEDPERLRAALTLALAQEALGKEARLFLQLDAVRVLAPPHSAPRDADHTAHGLPTLAQLIDDVLDAGIMLIACQSGLALANMRADQLDPRIEAGGPISFLQALGPDDSLITI